MNGYNLLCLFSCLLIILLRRSCGVSFFSPCWAFKGAPVAVLLSLAIADDEVLALEKVKVCKWI